MKIRNKKVGRAKIRKKGGLSEKDIQKVGKSSICCQFLSSEHVNTYARVGEAFINCMTLCHLEEGRKVARPFWPNFEPKILGGESACHELYVVIV